MKNILLTLLIVTTVYCGYSQTQVKFYTTLGDFIVELEDSLAPITTGNFKDLVQEKYYDGVTFHRVINNFMIQGGNGATKPNIQDEFHDSLSNVQGTISMANTGRVNSGNTQFFINLINNTRLDYNKAPLPSKHPVFGKVIENFGVVQAIGSAPVNNSVPNPAIYMDSLRFYPTAADTSNNGGGSNVSVYSRSLLSETSVEIYPNPLTNASLLKGKAHKTKLTLRLIDMLGNELTNRVLESNENELLIEMEDFSQDQLTSGIYFLESQSSTTTNTLRIVVP